MEPASTPGQSIPLETNPYALDFDFSGMRLEAAITRALSPGGKQSIGLKVSHIEVVLFSCEVFKDHLYIFRKRRIAMVTDSHVYMVNGGKRYFKKKDSIELDLIAVTQSLIIGQNNLVIHFKSRPDEELYCEK